MLVSADEDSNRFLVMAVAPKGVDVDCNAWVTAATEGPAGKGGGKKDSIQITVLDISTLEGVMEEAKQF
jgi:alanyl-tRNA synthetase